MKAHHFCVGKTVLSSHSGQLVLTQIGKFNFFHPDHHIFFKYAWHNHLYRPMMGEVSLET